ncbi:histone H3.Y [Plecturocebus cupreus]
MAGTKQTARKPPPGGLPRRPRPPTPPGKRALTTAGIRKPHRHRPGTLAPRKSGKYQKSTQLLLRKLPFQRLVPEIAQIARPDPRFQRVAIRESRATARPTGCATLTTPRRVPAMPGVSLLCPETRSWPAASVDRVRPSPFSWHTQRYGRPRVRLVVFLLLLAFIVDLLLAVLFSFGSVSLTAS